jgi:protein TonB
MAKIPLHAASLILLVSVTAFPASSQTLLHVEESVAKHAAIEKPAPTISHLARQMKVAGRVEVAIKIDTQGEVAKTSVVSGNPLLAETVLIALRHWKFHPFLVEGAPVAAATTLSFDFKQ